MTMKILAIVILCGLYLSACGLASHESCSSSAGAGGSSSASSSASGGGADAGPDTPPGCNTPCGWPVGADIDCAALGFGADGGCTPVMSDGDPCWRGVGICHAGTCVGPVGICDQAQPGPAWSVCSDDLECDDGNPCTEGDCPEPGCAACHQAPLPDGSPCGSGKTCKQGSCCA